MLNEYLGFLYLIEILSRSLKFEGRKLKVAHMMSEDTIKALKEIENVEVISDPTSADVLLADVNSSTDTLIDLVKELNSYTLLVVLNVVANIYRHPELLKELGLSGLTKSILPINGGAALLIKRGYDNNFFKKTVEVYRESFIRGPNPIDYNTATALYILAKFLTVRRKGVIVEVGTGRGFSTLWLAHATKETGSRVISLDNKCDRVDYASKVLVDLHLENYVDMLCTDATSYDHGKQDVVFVFIDGKKDEYHRYLETLEPYLLPGALILAHNTVSDAHVLKPYIEKVYRGPYRSITVVADPKGLTISIYAKSCT